MTEVAKRKYPVFGENECSQHFDEAFRDLAGTCVLCEVCGRVHFADDERFLGHDLAKLRRLRRNANRNPEGWIGHDSAVLFGSIFSKQVVFECQCGYAGYAEELLWNGRYPIAEYLAARATNEASNVKDLEFATQSAKEAVKQT